MKNKIKSPMNNALKYTLLIGFIYIIYQFLHPDSPKGNEFISYIVPKVFAYIVFLTFPFLLVIFYFKDKNTIDTYKTYMSKKEDEESELHSRETLREYHTMLKEGIITQEEYDNIKKKHLKSLHKD